MITDPAQIKNSLVGENPTDWLVPYGPTKRYISKYHWHHPQKGIVASYTPTANDVHDHFDIFRGVDQIESFAQSTVASCGAFSQCKKLNITPETLSAEFVPAFVSIGAVNFHSYLQKGQTFVNIGFIKFYKWRQMVCDGRIYRAPEGLDLDEYFKDFTEQRLLNYELSLDFVLITELFDITARGLKREVFDQLL